MRVSGVVSTVLVRSQAGQEVVWYSMNTYSTFVCGIERGEAATSMPKVTITDTGIKSLLTLVPLLPLLLLLSIA